MIKTTTNNFVFINESQTVSANDSANKRAVKAHAARFPRIALSQQHVQSLTRSAARWNRYQKGRRNRRPLFSINLSVDGLKSEPVQRKDSFTQTDDTGVVATSKGAGSRAGLSPIEDISSKTSSTELISPSMPGGGWAAPFKPHQSQGKAFIPLLVDHYLSNLATDIPELDAGHPGLLRSRWFPMVITESALLNIVLLTAASHYASFHPVPRVKTCLYYLKHEAITAINRHIDANSSSHTKDGGVVADDQIIGAVAKMASYEAMFGSPETYHTHMQALVKMVEMRGGLGMLGLGGLLMRMVLWIDVNSAFLLDCPVYFRSGTPLAGHVAVLEEPCPGHFLGAR